MPMTFSSLEKPKSVSIVVPIYNEVDNIELGCTEIREVMDACGRDYEVIFVDDGSTDGSKEKLREVTQLPRVKAVFLRRNYGQTAAMHAGIQAAKNDYTVTLDGDLQNDPRDIPAMLDKLDEDYDLVFGWRKSRKDKLVSRKIPSMLANKLISKVTGFPIHDLGCTLKAIRSEIAKDIELYGEMHRFIPILASNLGARCTEMEVNHRARQFGESKYGIGRSIPVLLDLMTIQYMSKYFNSPMKLFGLVGFLVSTLSMLSLCLTLIMKLFFGTDLTGNPLTYFAIVSAILGVQFFSLGLFGELSVRIYYSTGRKKSFQVRELLNFDENDAGVDKGQKDVERSKSQVRAVREKASVI